MTIRTRTLTPRLLETLEATAAEIQARGRGPTRAEIAERLGLSLAATMKRVNELLNCGMLSSTRAWNSLAVTPKGERLLTKLRQDGASA